jgi:hypothetical protein
MGLQSERRLLANRASEAERLGSVAGPALETLYRATPPYRPGQLHPVDTHHGLAGMGSDHRQRERKEQDGQQHQMPKDPHFKNLNEAPVGGTTRLTRGGRW